MRRSRSFAALGFCLALAGGPLAAADRTDREAAAILPQVHVSLDTPAGARYAPPSPLPIGTDHDMYCSGFVGSEREEWVGSVVSAAAVEAQSIFMETDIVYIDIGANRGVIPGQEFWVFRPDEVVYKYGSVTDALGRIYNTQARGRVICVQEDSSILELVRSCSDVQVGDLLMPYEPLPIPLVRRTRPVTSCEPANGKTLGHIIEVKERATPVADRSVVYLDLGDTDGVAPGDFFTVYRTHGQAKGVRTILGELAVLKTQPHTAVAVVTSMNDVMYAGDEIELK
jgi:hypothetical protein